MNMDILKLPELEAAAAALERYDDMGHIWLTTPRGHKLDLLVTRGNFEGCMILIRKALTDEWERPNE